MVDGSGSNSIVDKIQTDVLNWLKQNAVVVVLLLVNCFLAIQNFVMQSELGNIRAVLQSDLKTAETHETHETLKLAEESLQKGERDVAQVYFLNAAAKAPENIDILSRYAECVFERKPPDPSEIDRLRTVLQTATYQVNPKSVPTVLALLSKTGPLESGLPPLDTEPSIPESAPLPVRLAELEKVSADIWKNRDLLDKHLEQLRAFADQVETENPNDIMLIQNVHQLQRRWSAIDQTSRTAEFLEACLSSLTQLKTDSKLGSREAVALVQASDQMLVGFWGIDVALLPASLKDTRHLFPERIGQFVDDIAKARSLPFLAKIEALCKEAESNAPVEGEKEKTHQDRIKWFEGELEKSHLLLVEIKSTAELTTAQTKLRRIQELLSQTRREQFNEYQRFAIEKCSVVFRKFNDKWVVSEPDAESFFNAGKLYEIDQSLLSPEVNRLLSDLLGKLCAELSPAKLIQLESKMSNPDKKRKLETF